MTEMKRTISFALAVATATVLACIAPASAQDDKVEITIWETVRDSNVPTEIEAYLAAYPDGKFSSLARIRLNRLKATGAHLEGSNEANGGPTGAKSSSAQPGPVDDCDRLAAHPEDPDKTTAGVEWSKFDSAQAQEACEQAAAAHPDVPRLAFQLGRAFHAASKFEDALTQYRKAAALGYAPAMNGIGVLYGSGLGVAKDEAAAFEWTHRAAEQGFPTAMTGLGDMYAKGRGVARDDVAAVEWFKKGAEAGHHWAMFNLAIFYKDGRGVTKDLGQAEEWFRRAAAQGNDRAMNQLGILHLRGELGGQDLRQAVRWLEEAVGRGNTNAMTSLGAIYANGPVDKKGTSIPKDPETAADLLFRSVRSGNTATVENLIEHPKTWDADFQRALQRRLKQEGFYKGVVDGRFGPGTARAIRELAAASTEAGNANARKQAGDRTMVVIVPELNVFEQPSVDSKRVGTLTMNDRVVIERTQTGRDQEEWAWICRDRGCGWVATEFLQAMSSKEDIGSSAAASAPAGSARQTDTLPDLKDLERLD